MKRGALVLMAMVPGAALGQTNIDGVKKFSWSENLGWMNWADADAGAKGVRVNPTHLKGFIWSENAGYINTGNGPASGTAYNNTGADFGVNVEASGEMSGFAWGENIGWINFGAAASGTPARARVDRIAGRLRGYAWSENTGWINLDDPEAYVKVQGGGCYANCDQSTAMPVLNVLDFNCFLNRYSAGCQ